MKGGGKKFPPPFIYRQYNINNSIMGPLEDQDLELSSAGGEKTVDGSSKNESQLLRIAYSTAANGGRTIFFNMKDFDRAFLERLACVGKGNVYFDLR